MTCVQSAWAGGCQPMSRQAGLLAVALCKPHQVSQPHVGLTPACCLGAGDGAGPSTAELQERALAAEAAAEEAEGSLSDLLVCLGQEEHKVEVLSARLQAAGIDVDEVLSAIQERPSEDFT